jgi:hypothetical protein
MKGFVRLKTQQLALKTMKNIEIVPNSNHKALAALSTSRRVLKARWVM